MKKKIQDALEQAYAGKLGLTDKKVYARVAALGETYVANEEDIPAFVEKAEDLLKGFQGVDDQGRTLAAANARVAELEKKLKKLENPEDEDPQAEDGERQSDIAKVVADAVAAAMKPLTEKVESLENINSNKAALAGARETFFSGDYAKKYKDEAEDAWEHAVEVNELTGNKMTAEQLAEKANGYFNKAVSKKGVDTSKPFVADPPKGEDDEGTTDWSAEKKRLQDAGRLPKEKEQD